MATEVSASPERRAERLVAPRSEAGSKQPSPEQERRLSAILDQLRDGVAVFDQEGRCTYLTPRFLQMFGPAANAPLLGRDAADVLEALGPGVATRRLTEALQARLNAADVGEYRAEIELEQPEPRCLEWRCASLSSPDGAPLGAAIICRDLTRTKQLERRRQELSSLTSHELRTPLTSIKAYAQLAQAKLARLQDRSARPDPTLESVIAHLDTVSSQSDRLERLLNELLDVAAVLQGSFRLPTEVVDLAQVAERVCLWFRQSEDRRPVELRIVERPLVRVDAGYLGRAITILLDFAARSSEAPEPILVRVSVQRPRRGQEWAEVSVRDPGEPKPAEELAHLFELPTRGSALERYDSMLGIGLFLAAEVVRQCSGEISATSQRGVGNTYTILLPLASER